jgi:hypothetical protein
MLFSAGLLHHLDFRIRRTIVDGDAAAVIWDESATTAAGKPRENHGVDVIPSPERQNRRAPREQRHQSRLSAIPTIRPGSCERMMPRSREGDDLEGASPIGAMTDDGIRTP